MIKQIIRNNIKYLIFLALFGIVGGYFTTVYTLQSIDQEIIGEAVAQAGSIDVLVIVSTLQSLGYALFMGMAGKALAIKLGLWKKLNISNEAITAIWKVCIIGGAAFILADALIFNNFSEVVKNSYAVKPTIEYMIASITYGGVIEEVMMRLFFMTLIAFLIKKFSKNGELTDKILITSNVVSALLFAAGHLPSTAIMIGLTPMIVIRCFVMNGVFGLLFGRLYRKYGIHCSMIAHAGVHIVSKLIWILFI